MDWLVRAEGLTESEAVNVIADWTGNGGSVPAPDREQKIEYALSHWQDAVTHRRHHCRALSQRDPRHRYRPTADGRIREPALSSQLCVRTGALALSARTHA